MNESLKSGRQISNLALLNEQRSHILLILSNAAVNRKSDFLTWYLGPYRDAVSKIAHVLRFLQYERHEVDVAQGRFPPVPFIHVGLLELSIDGAEQASDVIDKVTGLHLEQSAAQAPATWIYYPAGERVGRALTAPSSMITIAYANGLPGHETEFREWYTTRHIRHAMNIEAFVSGQCFERSQFQEPGAMEATFSTIAIYEQEGTPESIAECFASLPESTLRFPTIDLSRFAESTYRRIEFIPHGAVDVA